MRKLELHWNFQPEDVPKQTSKPTKAWIQKNFMDDSKVAELPDWNPKESLWWNVKRTFTGSKAKNILEIEVIDH